MLCLISWFLENKRDFPWRQGATPYGVWVSEIMLQQTRACVVVPYFSSFIKRYPTVHALAKAEEQSVIKAWEGLGYYSRARNLRKGAQQVVERFGGDVPSEEESLRALSGIGEYTAGAIQAFAFHKRVAAVDGNVLRVISRLYGLQSLWGSKELYRQVKAQVLNLLPKEKAWVFMEALIELGAIICGKEPLCSQCPLQDICVAKQKDLQNSLPKKGGRPSKIRLERNVFILWFQGKVLVMKEERQQVMEGLCYFPYREGSQDEAWGGLAQGQKLFALQDYKHYFTKYQVTLKPSFWRMRTPIQMGSAQWVPVEVLSQYSFCAGHRQIAQWLVQGEYKKNIPV